jgi:Na+/H+-translocating membrane pyrophosphatase
MNARVRQGVDGLAALAVATVGFGMLTTVGVVVSMDSFGR